MTQKTIREIALEVANKITPDDYIVDDVMQSALIKYAESVLAAYLAQQEPLTHLRFRAARSYSGHGDIEHNEWLEECLPTDKGDDGLPAVQVFLAPPVPAGWKLVPVEPTEEMLAAASINEQDPARFRSVKIKNYKAMLNAVKEA